MSQPSIRTLAALVHHEIPKVKGSRFLAAAAPAASAEAARDFAESERALHRDASHTCWAWRLGDEDAFRWSDDGEPSGTAGRPILQEIDGRDLRHVVVAVTRWFGGTKLGTGGLIRAYGGAAGEVLDRATVVERPIVATLEIRFPYTLDGPVRGALNRFSLQALDAAYGADVQMKVEVPTDTVAELERVLGEVTAGRAIVRHGDEEPI